VILLDTQAIAWMALAPELLSETARRTIAASLEHYGVAISDKTLWELAMMVDRKQIAVSIPLLAFLREIERVCTVLPLDAAVAERSMSFGRRFPKDPADRIIAATAIVHALPLVTSDKRIRNSGEVACIW
jgi:PIN domain nuclease of toxin-antitoxin system